MGHVCHVVFGYNKMARRRKYANAAERRAANTLRQRIARSKQSKKAPENVKNAAQKAAARVTMSQQELEEHRAKTKAAVAARRAAMSEEEKAQQRAKTKAAVAARRAAMSEEEKAQQRAKTKAAAAARRAAMNDDEKAEQREKDRVRHATKVATMSQERKSKDAARKAAERAAMSPEERELQRIKDIARMAAKRAAMNEEKKGQFKTSNAALMAALRAARMANAIATLNKAHTTQLNATCAFRPAEAELIARGKVLGVVARNPERYQPAGNFILSCLSELDSLQAQVRDFKAQLQKTVTEAVTNAVKIHEGKRRATEVQSPSFVETSLTLEADKITTFENGTDPLLFQPGKECLSGDTCSSCEVLEPHNQNDKIVEIVAPMLSSDNKSANAITITKLECDICSKKFRTPFGFTVHQKEHDTKDTTEFHCSICLDVFRTYNAMSTHYLQVHSYTLSDEIAENFAVGETEETDEEFQRCIHEIEFLSSRKCLICSQTFNERSHMFMLISFSRHIMEKHSENKYLLKHFTHICARCDKPHSLQRYLEVHWKSFCFEKWKNNLKTEREIVCEQCGTKFSNEKSLCSHLKVFHTGKSVVCEECGIQCKNESSLKRHLKIHKSSHNFTCELCGGMFKNLAYLTRHSKFVHLGEKSFVCKFCSRRFTCLSNLQDHENIHKGEKPYECKICGKSFAARPSLVSHRGIHDGFKCKICGEMCRSYVHLYQHRKLKHPGSIKGRSKLNVVGSSGTNDKKKSPTSCEICRKLVKGFYSLRYHKRTVHEGRKYVCDICGKFYTTAGALDAHNFSHDNLKRFGCNLCGRQFRQATNFYQHRKVAHVNENAQIVKLTSEAGLSLSVNIGRSRRVSKLESANELEQALKPKQDPDAKPMSANTVEVHSSGPTTVTLPSINSSFNLQCEDSPELDDFLSGTEFDDEDNQSINNTSQFENADSAVLRKSCIYLENTHLLQETEHKPNLNNLKETNFDDAFNDQSIPCCSKLIDYSRANVPLGFSTPCNDKFQSEPAQQKVLASDTINDKHESQHKIFVEDSKDHTFVADVSIHDLVKLKTEPLCDIADRECGVSDMFDPNDEKKVNIKIDFDKDFIKKDLKFHRIGTPSPDLIVKLTKLLEYNCNPCKKTIFALNQREIRQHCRTHRKNISQKKEKYESRKSVGRMTDWYACLYCDASKFITIAELTDHCSKNHPGKEPFQCKICLKLFLKRKRLIYHKTKFHNPQKTSDLKEKKEFLCEQCGKTFTSSYSAKLHALNIHQEKKFQCDVCSKFFFRMKELQAHKKRHYGTKSHLCDECGRAFLTPSELKDHIQRVHQKINKRKSSAIKKPPEKTAATHPFPCNLCPYMFRKEIGLKKHLELHDPQRKYSCDECGLRYKFYANVVTHKDYKHKKVEK